MSGCRRRFSSIHVVPQRGAPITRKFGSTAFSPSERASALEERHAAIGRDRFRRGTADPRPPQTEANEIEAVAELLDREQPRRHVLVPRSVLGRIPEFLHEHACNAFHASNLLVPQLAPPFAEVVRDDRRLAARIAEILRRPIERQHPLLERDADERAKPFERRPRRGDQILVAQLDDIRAAALGVPPERPNPRLPPLGRPRQALAPGLAHRDDVVARVAHDVHELRIGEKTGQERNADQVLRRLVADDSPSGLRRVPLEQGREHIPRSVASDAHEPLLTIDRDAPRAHPPHEARALEVGVELREALPPPRIAVLADQPGQPRKEMAFVRKDRDVRMPVQQIAQQLRAGPRHADDEQDRGRPTAAHDRSIAMRVRSVDTPEIRLRYTSVADGDLRRKPRETQPPIGSVLPTRSEASASRSPTSMRSLTLPASDTAVPRSSVTRQSPAKCQYRSTRCSPSQMRRSTTSKASARLSKRTRRSCRTGSGRRS